MSKRILLALAFVLAGCNSGPDSGDTASDYSQGRVRGPDLGWRPATVVVPVR